MANKISPRYEGNAKGPQTTGRTQYVYTPTKNTIANLSFKKAGAEFRVGCHDQNIDSQEDQTADPKGSHLQMELFAQLRSITEYKNYYPERYISVM